MIIALQILAFFVLVWMGSIKIWNCAIGSSGKITREPAFVDVMLAVSATVLYIIHVVI